MTPLTQQLEDKKKILIELEKNGIKKEGYACGEDFTYWEFPIENQKTFHYVLEAEIAILEQAIAEIKRQRKEIIDKIRLEFHTFREEFIESELDIEDFDIGNLLYNIEQQLNQPKTER